MKKILIIVLCIFLFSKGVSYAADFIAPNSSGEPIVIDVSNLNLTSTIDVTVGEFTDQPRPYRDSNTKSLVIFPPPAVAGEKTIQVTSGSSSITKTISFRPSPSGILKNSSLPSLKTARGGNTATKISDGRVVLIGGGKTLASDPIDSIEIFDPETGKSEYLKTPNELKKATLETPRSQHTATYIGISNSPIGMIAPPVEQILVVGGFSKDALLVSSIEIVEIKVGTIQANSTLLSGKKSKLKKGRIFHTTSLLPDGRVLIVGGQGRISMTNLGALNSIEIFDPITKSVLPSGISLSTSRLLHTATTLQDGNILIAGGFTNEKQDEFSFGPATDSAELINTKNLTIKKVGSLKEKVGGHTGTLLTNGIVLLIGGNSDFFSSRTKDELRGLSKSTVQFYDTSSEAFNIVTNKLTGGNLELEIPRFLHSSVLLPNGNIAVIGGLNIKSGLSSASLINTPVSTIEVIDLDLFTLSGTSLKAESKTKLETTFGRISPTSVLVTPKNKTQGFLSPSDSNNFVNSAIFIAGGFTNGFGRLPTKSSEFIQIESTNGIEGRQIKSTPKAIIQGSYLSELLIELDKFAKVPSLKTEPQTINLSSSNDFMAKIKVLSTNNQIVLLKAVSSDPNGSIIVSPSLFQVGENISITRKDASVSGEFEINFVPADSTNDFIEAKLKVNVSDSAKPFLATVSGFGISLSNQTGSNSEKVQVKVLSQDGSTEISSIPPQTEVTATVTNPEIVNLGGTGISSIIGTLQTQFTINALKPGKASLNFSINFPDVLGTSIPIEVNGTPAFTSIPIDPTVLENLSLSGIEFSRTTKLNSTSVVLEDLRVSSTSTLFPIYVPINLQSSIDNSSLVGTFTIRPIFGIDLLTSVPRTFVNKRGASFKQPLLSEPTAIGGLVSNDLSKNPIAILASSDGIRSITYDQNTNEGLSESLTMLSGTSDIKDLKLFEFGDSQKIVAIKGNMLLVLDAESGDIETSTSLSSEGFELDLTKIDGQTSSVLSVGSKGIDLVFPITDNEPRIINFKLPGNTKNISVVEKLQDELGPFAIAYDDFSTISIVNLSDVNSSIKTIDTEGEKISKIDYAGRFTVNGMTTDILVGITQREVLLFDLNNLTSIPTNDKLEIKSQIEDILVIDGVAYLALGNNGIMAISIGSLIDTNNKTDSVIAHFKKNKLAVIKSSGRLIIKSKVLSAKKLADSKPFLLSSGEENNLTVIKVSP